MIAFMAIGIYSASLTPREEEPQIDVPIADIFIGYPGASPQEVESRVIEPLEKLLTNIQGVEYVYSTAMNGQAMLIVRFYVGEDVERSLVKFYNEVMKHMDSMPAGVTMPLIKTRSIDDVPALGLTLWSKTQSDFELKRIAEELASEIKKVTDVAETTIIGGRSRELSVLLNKEKMAAYGLDALTVAHQIKSANQQMEAGAFSSQDTEFLVEVGDFLKTSDDLKSLVVGVANGSPIYLKQIAKITDGAEQSSQYVTFGYGKDANTGIVGDFPAVTISVSKRRGADAMGVSELILGKVETLKQTLIPK